LFVGRDDGSGDGWEYLDWRSRKYLSISLIRCAAVKAASTLVMECVRKSNAWKGEGEKERRGRGVGVMDEPVASIRPSQARSLKRRRRVCRGL
jgi:hypothetical protein